MKDVMDVREADATRAGELVKVVIHYPMEALIVQIKFATLKGLIATFPLKRRGPRAPAMHRGLQTDGSTARHPWYSVVERLTM